MNSKEKKMHEAVRKGYWESVYKGDFFTAATLLEAVAVAGNMNMWEHQTDLIAELIQETFEIGL